MRSPAPRRRRAWFRWRFVKGESRRSYRLAFLLFWSLLLYFICQRYVVSLGIVTDKSMLPTLPEGSYFLVNKYVYHLTRPARGDIVVLRGPAYTSEEYVKRVIGLEGDMLLIRGGAVYLNGHRLIEPYAVGATFPDLGPLRVGPGMYYVMGDNRVRSEDSRAFGPVALRDLEGKISPGKLFSFR